MEIRVHNHEKIPQRWIILSWFWGNRMENTRKFKQIAYDIIQLHKVTQVSWFTNSHFSVTWDDRSWYQELFIDDFCQPKWEMVSQYYFLRTIKIIKFWTKRNLKKTLAKVTQHLQCIRHCSKCFTELIHLPQQPYRVNYCPHCLDKEKELER